MNKYKRMLNPDRSSEKRISLLQRTAREVRGYRRAQRILSALLVLLLIITTAVYIVSVLYKNQGSFTVHLDKYDMSKYGLSLSESRELTHMTSHLNAKIAEQMTNISEKAIAANVDMIDGEHNGRDYIAYTFYLQNAGDLEVSYDYTVKISNVTNDLDEAIRLRLYVNGVPTTYAKTRSDGQGAEPGTKEFYSETVMARGRVPMLAPGEVTKYTVVIWLEGNDPDCLDWLIGGKMKVEMEMAIVH